MIALLSRWKLRDGCPPQFLEALQALTVAVSAQEPGTLVYSVLIPAPHPPIGPPPQYEVCTDPDLARPMPPNELCFFEVYRDSEAYSAHLRGVVNDFMRENRDYFHTPWQGHPRPETIHLDPQHLFVRSDVVEKRA